MTLKGATSNNAVRFAATADGVAAQNGMFYRNSIATVWNGDARMRRTLPKRPHVRGGPRHPVRSVKRPSRIFVQESNCAKRS